MASLPRLRHDRHVFNAPISAEKFDEAIKMLELPPGAKVLDIGCGYGESLLRIASQYGVDAVGVDLDQDALALAAELQAEYAARLMGSVTFECRKWQDANAAKDLDLVVCIGSTQAFGTLADAFRNTLFAAKGMLKPGGKLLLGDLYWRRHPSKVYLAMLECEASSYGVWQEDVLTARDAGYTVLAAWESSLDEFDAFESGMWAAVEDWYNQAPDAPERLAKWDGVREWRDTYLREGRETLGFGLYLLQKK